MTSEEITTSMLTQAAQLIKDGETERAGDLITAALNRIKRDYEQIKPQIWKNTRTR